MKYLCKDVRLPNEYTNHSIRATVITNLSNCGYEARHIIAVTGHKSESTVKQYATRCPDTKKRQMCDSLANKLNPSKIVKCEASTSAPQNTVANTDFSTINFGDMDFKLQQLPDDPEDNLLSQILDDIEKEQQKQNQPNQQNNNQTQPTEQQPTNSKILIILLQQCKPKTSTLSVHQSYPRCIFLTAM